jgi:hypothetical protein
MQDQGRRNGTSLEQSSTPEDDGDGRLTWTVRGQRL